VRRRPPENIDARENLASVPPLSLPFACVRRRFALSCVALRVCCPGIFSTLNRPGPVPRPGRREKAWIQPTQGLTEHAFFLGWVFFHWRVSHRVLALNPARNKLNEQALRPCSVQSREGFNPGRD
jgi:hypothetical protein